MSLPTSHLAYVDCYGAMDKAIDDPLGVRLKQVDMDAAQHLRQRMNYARKIDRKRNAETYEVGHAMHGVSQYDALVCRIKRDASGDIWLYLEKREDLATEAESLSDETPEAEVVTNTQEKVPLPPLVVSRRV